MRLSVKAKSIEIFLVITRMIQNKTKQNLQKCSIHVRRFQRCSSLLSRFCVNLKTGTVPPPPTTSIKPPPSANPHHKRDTFQSGYEREKKYKEKWRRREIGRHDSSERICNPPAGWILHIYRVHIPPTGQQSGLSSPVVCPPTSVLF